MDARQLWERFQRSTFRDEESGFTLDVSRMDLPADWPAAMDGALQPAFDAMDRLEAGAIANPDEQRRVGHYWLRSPDLAPDAETAREIRETLDAVLEFARSVHGGELRPQRAPRFERLLIVGIGGSALGPQFVAAALHSGEDRMVPVFLDNTDPDGIDRTLRAIGDGLSTTLTLVISKSGGTPETRNGMLEVRAAYAARGLDFDRHAAAITGAGSALDRVALEEGFLARFPMWDWVGGRTSETSVVGLLPAALQGIDVHALLAGAAEMDRWTRRRDAAANPAALLALCWYHAGAGRGAKDMVLLPYKDRLALFSRYLQQLVMESLGKARNLDGQTVNQGLTVYGNKGSTDQHALVQQLRDGTPDFFVTFIAVQRDREGHGIEVEPAVTSGDFLHGFLLGTRRALYENGRPSITITVRDVSPRNIGQLIALFERAVGLYALLIGVNAYNQPGVEAGKKAAASVLDVQRRLIEALRERGARGATCEELAEQIGAPEESETAFHLLERLAANPERGIRREGSGEPFDAIYRLAED